MKKTKKEKKPLSPLEKRFHVTSAILTAAFICYGAFAARYSWQRTAEEVLSLLLSVAFYLCRVIGIKDLVDPCVHQIPDVPFVPFLPYDPDIFVAQISAAWKLLFTRDNFVAYLMRVSEVAKVISKLSLPAICLFLLLFLWFNNEAEKENDDYGEDTKGLKRLKRILGWFRGPIETVREYFTWAFDSKWKTAWIWIWLANLNILSVCVAVVSYYFYFTVTFDLVNLYLQLYKLSLDIAVAGAALPLLGWLCIFYWVFDKLRIYFALETLKKFECRNRAFLETLPLVTLITGKMETNKTKTLTDFGLSFQDLFRDRQKKQMFEIQAEFPFYDWIGYGNEIKWAFAFRQIRSIASARKFARKKKERYIKTGSPYQIRGYDIGKYSLFFDNGIVKISLFNRLEDYAALMYMYILQSVLAGNYSVRLEDVYVDKGKFPLWANDYFGAPSVDREAIYRHCHKMNFDTLRLGLTVDPESDCAGAFECGVVLHTEMGKDYGNKETNDGYKRTDKKANPKNDMMVPRQKMSRHSSTVCFFPYYRYVGDEQRPESVGADLREVLVVVRALKRSEDKLAIRMFLAESFLYDVARSIWQSWFVRYSHNRADHSCLEFFVKKFVYAVNGWYRRKTMRFTFNVMDLSVEEGTLEGEKTPATYFLSHKKIHADRYRTDCFADIFAERAEQSSWSFEDSPCFEGDVATSDEIMETNTYFGAALLKIKNGNRPPKDAASPETSSGRPASGGSEARK